jgi:hypothetical protein
VILENVLGRIVHGLCIRGAVIHEAANHYAIEAELTAWDRAGGWLRRYPGGTENTSILATVQGSSPNRRTVEGRPEDYRGVHPHQRRHLHHQPVPEGRLLGRAEGQGGELYETDPYLALACANASARARSRRKARCVNAGVKMPRLAGVKMHHG